MYVYFYYLYFNILFTDIIYIVEIKLYNFVLSKSKTLKYLKINEKLIVH